MVSSQVSLNTEITHFPWRVPRSTFKGLHYVGGTQLNQVSEYTQNPVRSNQEKCAKTNLQEGVSCLTLPTLKAVPWTTKPSPAPGPQSISPPLSVPLFLNPPTWTENITRKTRKNQLSLIMTSHPILGFSVYSLKTWIKILVPCHENNDRGKDLFPPWGYMAADM